MDKVVIQNEVTERGKFQVFRGAVQLHVLVNVGVAHGVVPGFLRRQRHGIEPVPESRPGIVEVIPNVEVYQGRGGNLRELHIGYAPEDAVVP